MVEQRDELAGRPAPSASFVAATMPPFSLRRCRRGSAGRAASSSSARDDLRSRRAVVDDAPLPVREASAGGGSSAHARNAPSGGSKTGVMTETRGAMAEKGNDEGACTVPERRRAALVPCAPVTCRVFVSAHGNVFMREIAEHLVEALVAAARPARARRSTSCPRADGGRHQPRRRAARVLRALPVPTRRPGRRGRARR